MREKSGEGQPGLGELGAVERGRMAGAGDRAGAAYLASCATSPCPPCAFHYGKKVVLAP